MWDIYGGVTQLAVQIFRSERMSTTFRSYTHFAVRGQQANSLQMSTSLLNRKMFATKLVSKLNLDTTLHCLRLVFIESGVPCILILVTYDSMLILFVVTLHRLTVIVKGWMNVCVPLKAAQNVNLINQHGHTVFFFIFRWIRQRPARGDGYGCVQSTWGGALRGGRDLEPGRVHTLHLQEGTCPVRHWSVSPDCLPYTNKE